jgi:hypothetical protein
MVKTLEQRMKTAQAVVAKRMADKFAATTRTVHIFMPNKVSPTSGSTLCNLYPELGELGEHSGLQNIDNALQSNLDVLHLEKLGYDKVVYCKDCYDNLVEISMGLQPDWRPTEIIAEDYYANPKSTKNS